MNTTVDEKMAELIGLVKSRDHDLDSMAKVVADLQIASQRRDILQPGTPARAPATTWRDLKSGNPVYALGPDQSVASTVETKGPMPSAGRILRGLVMGSAADDCNELAEERKYLNIGSDVGGGFTVPSPVAGFWIDKLRAASAVSRAGATTVPMESSTLQIARLTSHPISGWHAENEVLSDADVNFGAVTLRAKTVYSMVRLSLELAQDSPNIEQMLEKALFTALAGEIDYAAMNGSSATGIGGAPFNSALGPTGVFSLPNRNKVTGIGAPTNFDFILDGLYKLAEDNVDISKVGAMIGHPKLWRKLTGLKTGISGDQTTLAMPAEVARVPHIWSTAAPLSGGTTATAMLADWSDLLWGIRKDISVRVLRESFLGSHLQVGILAYARCDFAPAREESFCSLEGITV